MPLPFISVVVPVYNGSRTIRRCVDALLNQDYPLEQHEILIIDNGSTDDTLVILNRYPRLTILSQTEVQSSYAARNTGITASRGEIVLFTDSDCAPAPSWIADYVAAFQDPMVLAVGGRVINAPSDNLVECFVAELNPFRPTGGTADQFLTPLPTVNVGYRRHILDAEGGFNSRLYTGADIDLSWRIQLHYGSCVLVIPGGVVSHQHRSTTNNLFRQFRRFGFGEIFIDAMYCRYQGYPRNLAYQLRRVLRQTWALVTYLASFVLHLLRYPFRRDRYYLIKPLLLFVAESGTVFGKLQGLWITRALRRDPSDQQWHDPGG